jgi:hypothetical protein
LSWELLLVERGLARGLENPGTGPERGDLFLGLGDLLAKLVDLASEPGDRVLVGIEFRQPLLGDVFLGQRVGDVGRAAGIDRGELDRDHPRGAALEHREPGAELVDDLIVAGAGRGGLPQPQGAQQPPGQRGVGGGPEFIGLGELQLVDNRSGKVARGEDLDLAQDRRLIAQELAFLVALRTGETGLGGLDDDARLGRIARGRGDDKGEREPDRDRGGRHHQPAPAPDDRGNRPGVELPVLLLRSGPPGRFVACHCHVTSQRPDLQVERI